MKDKISDTDKNEFYRILHEVKSKAKSFNIDNAEVATAHQIVAIKDHGGFLSLVPKSDYHQVAYNLLESVYLFNLCCSEKQYRLSSPKIKTKEKLAIEADIKNAKKYFSTIENTPNKELARLVQLNINEMEHLLSDNDTLVDEIKTGHFYARDYETIERYKYAEYKTGNRFTKRAIKETLKRIVNTYNIEDCGNAIDELVDKL